MTKYLISEAGFGSQLQNGVQEITGVVISTSSLSRRQAIIFGLTTIGVYWGVTPGKAANQNDGLPDPPLPPAAGGRPISWPQEKEEALVAFFGDPRGDNGASRTWERANLVRVLPPYQMTYAGRPIASLTVHSKVEPSLTRVLKRIWEASSFDQSVIDQWGASIYGGGYNYRLKRGGSSLSMHAYGAAIDLDPTRNGFGDTTPNFYASHPVVIAFEAEGWTWGGRWKGSSCDGMHFQAVR